MVSAVRFDNTADTYQCASTGLDAGAVTFACWVMISVDRNNYTFWMSSDNGSSGYFSLGTWDNGEALTFITNGSDKSDLNLTVGTWYYTACVYDPSGTDYLYYAPSGTSTLTQLTVPGTMTGITASWTFWLGTDGFDEWLNGRLAQVKVWTAALTKTELEAEMPVDGVVRTSGLWAYWSFRAGPQTNDEKVGGTAHNLTASGTLTTEAGPTDVVDSGISGTIAVTLDAVTSSISGTVAAPSFDGTIAVTLADTTSTISGTVASPPIDGTIAATLDDVTPAMSGTSVPPAITGTIAVTGEGVTSAMSGTLLDSFVGTIAVTLADATSTIDGVSAEFAGTIAATLNGVTPAINGTFTPLITGTIGVTLADATSTITGTFTIGSNSGTIAVTLAGATSAIAAVYAGVFPGLFPTAISANGRYLLDQEGNPWFLFGDSPWELCTQLGPSDVDLYLEDRAAKGFNGVLIQFTDDAAFTDNGPNNYNNDPPFTGTPYASTTTGAADAFWDHVEYCIDKAADLGITVFAAPCYQGANDGEGWRDKLGSPVSATTFQTFGVEMGNRFKTYPNLVWVAGGDDQNNFGTYWDGFFTGLTSVGDTHLRTYHGGVGSRASTEANSEPWLDIDNTYSYPDNNNQAVSIPHAAWTNGTTRPIIYVEGVYEITTSRWQLRRQMYGPVFAGSLGGFFWGNGIIWHFNGIGGTPWEDQLDTDGTADAIVAHNFVTSLTGWHTLAPDLSGTFLTAGLSTNENIASAAYNATLGIVYVPSNRSITINRALFTPSTLRIRWFNPITAAYTDVSTSVPNTGTQTITHPGNNGTGTFDWVLVVDSLETESHNMYLGTTAVSAIYLGTTLIEGGDTNLG